MIFTNHDWDDILITFGSLYNSQHILTYMR